MLPIDISLNPQYYAGSKSVLIGCFRETMRQSAHSGDHARRAEPRELQLAGGMERASVEVRKENAMPRWLKYLLIALALFLLIAAPLAMQTGVVFR
jgi:hypothetical protein